MNIKILFKKEKKVIFFLLIFLIFFSINIFLVSAQATADAPVTSSLKNPIPKIKSIEGFIKELLIALINIGLPIVAFAFAYAGFLFVFAQGKSDKITEAKKALLYSAIGAVLLLGAWAIAEMISATVDKLK